jgi:hypothetical protein
MSVVIVPKYAKVGQGFSRRERLMADEHPGRPSGGTAGSWISDFVSLQKMISLCPLCLHKFNPRQNGYEVWRREVQLVGKCDDCKQMTPYLKGFIHQSLHDIIGEPNRPTKGRWRLKPVRRPK